MRLIKDAHGTEVAMILDTSDYTGHKEKMFFSNYEDTLQVGSLFFISGSKVVPHKHLPIEAGGSPMEIILVLSGKATASFFNDDGKLIEQTVVVTGDLLIQKAGGHGFEFTGSDATFLEIKRGPYRGRDFDKEELEQ